MGKQEEKSKPFCIGVKVTETNAEDIAYYNEQFREINRLYKDQVKLLFLGYRPENDKDNMLDGVIYEYVKPVSIIHYFKQLKACEVDILFIPLINSTYNITSEDYYKYTEAGIMEIPVLTVEIYPYNKIIASDKQSDFNGFLYESRDTFIPYLKELLADKVKDGIVKLCGKRAHESVMKSFNYSRATTPKTILNNSADAIKSIWENLVIFWGGL